MEELNKETLNNKWNNVAPSTESQDKADIDEGKQEIVEYPSYDTPNISLLENVSTESQEIIFKRQRIIFFGSIS